jgi:hypothetical protein
MWDLGAVWGPKSQEILSRETEVAPLTKRNRSYPIFIWDRGLKSWLWRCVWCFTLLWCTYLHVISIVSRCDEVEVQRVYCRHRLYLFTEYYRHWNSTLMFSGSTAGKAIYALCTCIHISYLTQHCRHNSNVMWHSSNWRNWGFLRQRKNRLVNQQWFILLICNHGLVPPRPWSHVTSFFSFFSPERTLIFHGMCFTLGWIMSWTLFRCILDSTQVWV